MPSILSQNQWAHGQKSRPIAWSNEKSSILAILGKKFLLSSKLVQTPPRWLLVQSNQSSPLFKPGSRSASKTTSRAFLHILQFLVHLIRFQRSQCVVTHFLPRIVTISTTSHTPNSAGRSNSSSSDFCNILMAFETLCKVHIFSSRYCGPSHFHKSERPSANFHLSPRKCSACGYVQCRCFVPAFRLFPLPLRHSSPKQCAPCSL